MVYINLTDTEREDEGNTQELHADGCIVVTLQKTDEGELLNMHCIGACDDELKATIALYCGIRAGLQTMERNIVQALGDEVGL